MEVFTEDESENLIYLVSQKPCLFNYKSHDYKDQRIRENFWKEIAKQLNKSSDTCKKQWKTIRDGYNRFKRKNKLPSGSEAPKSSRTKWKLYRLLSFLDNLPHEKLTVVIDDASTESSQHTAAETSHETTGLDLSNIAGTSHSAINITKHSAEEASGSDSLSDPLTTGQHMKSKKRLRMNRDYMRERKISRLSITQNKLEDEFNSFANHIEHVLKKMPNFLQIKAKQEIFEVLTKYEMMALDNTSF